MRGGAAFPVRLQYTKRGKVRWISHRDVARAFERAFRIAQLPLAFTEGFSPRPKVSFGLALSTGYESDAEYLDVEFASPVDIDALRADHCDSRLRLPSGRLRLRLAAQDSGEFPSLVPRSGHRRV